MVAMDFPTHGRTEKGGEVGMKKILLLVVLALILIVSLCGCEEYIDETHIESIQRCTEGKIVVDSTTGVMYWMSTAAYNRGTLTLLVNTDGSPRTLGGDGE